MNYLLNDDDDYGDGLFLYLSEWWWYERASAFKDYNLYRQGIKIWVRHKGWIVFSSLTQNTWRKKSLGSVLTLFPTFIWFSVHVTIIGRISWLIPSQFTHIHTVCVFILNSSVVHMSTCVQMSISLKFLLWSSLALLLLQTGNFITCWIVTIYIQTHVNGGCICM